MTISSASPPAPSFGQLLTRLINGAFYAMLSLGLAVIFGLLTSSTSRTARKYMMGAFCAWVAPRAGRRRLLVVAADRADRIGLVGVVIERTMLSKLYKLDHLYGLLLTFGLALIIQGVFTNYYGSSGQPYRLPEEFVGTYNLGLHVPAQVSRVGDPRVVIVCFVDLVRDRAHQARLVPSRATENPALVQAFGINVPRMITLTYGFGVGLAALAGRDGRADLPGEPADGRQPHHRRVRRGRDRRHGLDHGRDP
jgi:branched-chain amino acid transport system permease protein